MVFFFWEALTCQTDNDAFYAHNDSGGSIIFEGGWLTWQNDIGTIGDKIASVIVLFPFLILLLKRPQRGGWLATQSTSLDPPLNELSIRCLTGWICCMFSGQGAKTLLSNLYPKYKSNRLKFVSQTKHLLANARSIIVSVIVHAICCCRMDIYSTHPSMTFMWTVHWLIAWASANGFGILNIAEWCCRNFVQQLINWVDKVNWLP